MQIAIGSFPLIVAEMFGTTEFVGGYLLTLILYLVTLFPTFIVLKDNGLPWTVLGHTTLVLLFTTAVGWIDIWALIFMAFVFAGALAQRLSTTGD